MNLEKLKNLIPFLSLLVILSNAIKLITYYRSFGISIIDYMEWSEFTFSFLEDIYGYIIMLSGIMVFQVIDDLFGKTIKPAQSSKPISKRHFYRKLIYSFLFIYGASSLACYWFMNWIVYYITLIAMIFIYIIFSDRSKRIDSLTKYYLLIPTLILFSYFNAKRELSMIKEKVSAHQVVLQINNDKISTNKEIHYLGRTKNYTFFYNSTTKLSTIYPNKNIQSIDVSEDRILH